MLLFGREVEAELGGAAAVWALVDVVVVVPVVGNGTWPCWPSWPSWPSAGNLVNGIRESSGTGPPLGLLLVFVTAVTAATVSHCTTSPDTSIAEVSVEAGPDTPGGMTPPEAPEGSRLLGL